jgi:hypothetical protein
MGLHVEPGTTASRLAAVAVALAAIGVALRTTRHPGWLRRALEPRRALVSVLALATPLGLALYSALPGDSIWNIRNLIASTPGLALLVSSLLVAASSRWALRAVPAVLLITAMTAGAVQLASPSRGRAQYDEVARFIAEARDPRAPVVELVAQTPGPPTAMEAALALSTEPEAQKHPVLRIGAPPLAAVLRAPAYAQLPSEPVPVVTRRAVRLAGGGELFYVLPLRVSFEDMAAFRRESARGVNVPPFVAFLDTLPPRYRLVRAAEFDGSADVSVFEFAAS